MALLSAFSEFAIRRTETFLPIISDKQDGSFHLFLLFSFVYRMETAMFHLCYVSVLVVDYITAKKPFRISVL
jgi:hypothetical protein